MVFVKKQWQSSQIILYLTSSSFKKKKEHSLVFFLCPFNKKLSLFLFSFKQIIRKNITRSET